MIRRLIYLGVSQLLILPILIFGMHATAFAHHEIKDVNSNVEALFHVSPDDDPIAGTQSTISFDFSQSGITIENSNINLIVKNDRKNTTKIPIEVISSVVLGEYTFPYQGLYTVSLDIKAKDGSASSQLSYDQLVSRGTVRKESSFERGTVGLICLPLLLAVALIIAFNYKDRIMSSSKSKSNKE